jgi:hypothetical protein
LRSETAPRLTSIMTLRNALFPPLLALLVTFGLPAGARSAAQFDVIKFNDLTEGLTVRLQWSWHAIGIDPDDNVYVVFGGLDGDSADCALFQYQSRTGKRRLIGTLSAAAKEAGTWREGERIEKGHTHLPWLNGKLYIGTMGFHDASAVSPEPMEIAARSHGAHLMVYDPVADKIEDLSRNQPDGVFFPQRGFMCLSPVPETGWIAGLTVPHGDLLLYDPATRQPHTIVPGIPEEFGKLVTREVVVAPNGRVYTMYSGGSWAPGPGHMYYYDLRTKTLSKPIAIAPDYWNGSVQTKNGRAIYIMTDPGDLYRLHPDTNTVERIGCLYPEADRRVVEDSEHLYRPPHVLGMVLSADEKSIYSIPLRKRILKADQSPKTIGDAEPRGPQVPFGLFRFDLATRVSHRIADVPSSVGHGYLTGTNIRDRQGNFYFAHHGGSFLGLVKVSPGSR